ncbi:MAG: HAMP domain-containing protein [Anaerolineales bacterium]|nr:HAMP domain-containing protein [Anaerolineales bacterium]
MEYFFSLWSETRFFTYPQTLVGWIGWFALAGLLLFLLWRSRHYHDTWKAHQWVLLVLFFLITPFTALLFGVRLPSGNALPIPSFPLVPQGPALMLFSELTWVLAAGLLGPLPAALLAGLTGVIVGFFDTHSPFTMLEYALIAVMFSAAVKQRYRTLLFRFLRRPFIAGAALSVLYPLLYLISNLFLIGGDLAVRLDYGLSRAIWVTVGFSVPLLFACVLGEAIAFTLPKVWQGSGPLVPSPAERSLETRLLYILTPLFILLAIFLIAGDWIVSGELAQRNLETRLESTAVTAAQSVPYFLETGQSLITQLAQDPVFSEGTPEEIQQRLQQGLRAVPYFRQLYLLDTERHAIAGYPVSDFVTFPLASVENTGLDRALAGVIFQSFSVPPLDEDDETAELSFMAAVVDETGQINRVLLGRTDLSTNPFFQSVLESLATIRLAGGDGLIVDEQGLILAHPAAERIMQPYTGSVSETPQFFTEPGPDGTRQIVFYYPVSGRSWAVVTSIPVQLAQQQALSLTLPRLGLLLILAVISFILLRITLRFVTGSLQTLATESGRIASGQLETALSVDGTDEIGQLGQAFERMRVSLKSRLDEINRLLSVSQGVASSLEMEAAVKPILEAALTTGASTARLVLSSAVVNEIEGDMPKQFGLGPANDRYHSLDQQVLDLTKEHESVTLTNPARAGLRLDDGSPPPASLMAIALRHENRYYGTLWVAYDQPHQFTVEEDRFLSTVAGQAALAAANARLYLNAQIGRQRLAAILASTPDPVLVTDHRNRMYVANPAACELLAEGNEPMTGSPVEDFVQHADLLKLLQASDESSTTTEVVFPNDKVFYATASPVMTEGQQMGRVCLLRDITYLKEVDALKSEFVNTVSHDLRSPLTLMRGYATMLEMVGELNEQQEGYVRNIVIGVESMSRLVNNLLDLGRIEAGVGLQLEMVPVVDVVRQVSDALQLNAAQKNIEMTVDVPQETMPLVEADQALLHQAIHNLVENAIKYTEQGGKVWVKIQERGAQVQITVRDNGIGIAPVDQPRLFEKFYRAATRDSRKERGSGLGLAIVKSIAERHGGRVWMESQLGRGSTFYLQIPQRQPKPDKD